MQSYRFRHHLLVALALTGLLTMIAGGWRLCERSDGMAFLPGRAGVEWIIDPAPAEITGNLAVSVRVTFKKTFVLDAVPAGGTLTIRAFKSATVSLNGHTLTGLKCDGQNWKLPATASVNGLLRAGTNEITVAVTNSYGPPALWLRLEAGGFSLPTDRSWLSSPVNSHWLNAQPATQPPTVTKWSPLYDGTDTLDALGAVWWELALFAAISLALVFGATHWLKQRTLMAGGGAPGGRRPTKFINLLLVLVLAVRAALFIHDAPKLPRETGFDAPQHEDYVKFIQEKKTLPLPNDGWEMHQPPLYYGLAALWLGLGGYAAGTDAALLPLRLVNGVIGLLQCWLVLLCLRRLFPQNFSAQAAGLLVCAFLPADLYLSMYVTNDPLAGLLVTLAFYFFLRLDASEMENSKLAFAIGLALGAGMLAKLNSLVAVPVFLGAMGLRLWRRGNFNLWDWLRGPGAAVLACGLMCGWHYYRVWQQIGGLPLPNCQTDPATAWWQFPGYRTAGYYLHFGAVLATPLFGGLHSFADGIYSTLWGDGLISGYSGQAARPPWNYDLMKAGYLLALAISALAIIGWFKFVRRGIRELEPAGVLIAGMIFTFAASILFETLQGPWLAGVKAFYGLPALAPFCALIAAGWVWLGQKSRGWQMALWVVLVFWALTAVSSFWIRTESGQYLRIQAMIRFPKGDVMGATESLSRALKLNPADARSHRLLANILSVQGRTAEALGEYAAALTLQPDAPEVLDEVAQILANGQKDDAERAVKFASRACELTEYRQASYVTTLAVAQAKAGQPEAAFITAQIAHELATQNGDKNLQKKTGDLMEQAHPARE